MPSSDWTVGSSVGGVYVGGSESVSVPYTGCVEVSEMMDKYNSKNALVYSFCFAH
jgi:hypothetical protein